MLMRAKDVGLLSCVGLYQWSTRASCQLSSLNELPKVEVETIIGHLEVFFAYSDEKKGFFSKVFSLLDI